jgi:hypothetical protein
LYGTRSFKYWGWWPDFNFGGGLTVMVLVLKKMYISVKLYLLKYLSKNI